MKRLVVLLADHSGHSITALAASLHIYPLPLFIPLLHSTDEWYIPVLMRDTGDLTQDPAAPAPHVPDAAAAIKANETYRPVGNMYAIWCQKHLQQTDERGRFPNDHTVTTDDQRETAVIMWGSRGFITMFMTTGPDGTITRDTYQATTEGYIEHTTIEVGNRTSETPGGIAPGAANEQRPDPDGNQVLMGRLTRKEYLDADGLAAMQARHDALVNLALSGGATMTEHYPQ